MVRIHNGAMGPMGQRSAACYVSWPLPRLTLSAKSISSDARNTVCAAVRELSVPTPREKTLVRLNNLPPLPIPRAQAVPEAETGEQTKTAAASLSCICHNCDLTEQSENAGIRLNCQ